MTENSRRFRSFWGRLSRAQRITVWVLGGTLFVCAALGFAAWKRDETYQVLVEAQPDEDAQNLRTLLSLLDAGGIPWRSRRSEGGTYEILVPAGPDFHHAIFVAADRGFDAGRSSVLDWIFGRSEFLESSEKIHLKLDESKRRLIEKSIRWNPNIVSASLLLQRGKRSQYVNGDDRDDSASVALRLRDPEDALSAPEAATIRRLISGAFSIPPERIEITDAFRYYGATGSQGEGDAALASSPQEDKVRREVSEVVKSLLGVYKPHEYRLGVLVSRSRSRGEAREGGSDKKPFRPPGESEPGERARSGDKAARSPRPAREEGGLGVRVNLVLDIEAVKRVLEERDKVLKRSVGRRNLAEEIERYENEQEEFLLRQLPMRDVQVTVAAQVFARPTPPPPAAITAAVNPAESQSRLMAQAGGLEEPAWILAVACGTLAAALLVLAMLWRAGRSSKTASGRDEGGSETVSRRDATAPSACAATLLSVQKANDVAAEHPELAASILRLWLGEGREMDGRGPLPCPPRSVGDDERSSLLFHLEEAGSGGGQSRW